MGIILPFPVYPIKWFSPIVSEQDASRKNKRGGVCGDDERTHDFFFFALVIVDKLHRVVIKTN